MHAAPFFWTEEVARAFPPAFVEFLKANDIHPDNYAIHDVPRYVRVSPQHAESLSQSELERQRKWAAATRLLCTTCTQAFVGRCARVGEGKTPHSSPLLDHIHAEEFLFSGR